MYSNIHQNHIMDLKRGTQITA